MEENRTFLANSRDAETGRPVYEQILKEFETGPEINRQLLMQILRDNQETEYGRKHGFADITSVEEYQQRVPVITYDAIADSIERMANGEQNVLTAYPFQHMNLTSGTIGTEKKIPMTGKQVEVFLKYNKCYTDGMKATLLDPSWMNGRTLCTQQGKHQRLPSGITVGFASSAMAETIQGGKDAMNDMLTTLYTSPVEAVVPEPGTDTTYIHTRFALMDREITGIIASFNSMLLLGLKYVDANSQMLIDDIENGTICKEVRMPEKTRESLLRKIRPMPERAAELREIFRDGPGSCWVPKVWPHIQYYIGVGGDGFSIYDKIIKKEYTGNCLKNIYSGVIASEGLWSVPSGLDTEDGVIAPGSAFIEFLPEEAGDDFSQCVTMDRVEAGKVYELIVTNLCGFYRYRTSDAVKVTGFRGATPMIRFMYRINRTINMTCEKTTEKALQTAVEAAMAECGLKLQDFCVWPNYETFTYEFLIEPAADDPAFSREAMAECILRHMREANELFGENVDGGALGKPVVHWLQPQTAILYRDMMVFNGAPASQIKPVRVIINERQRKFFYGLRKEEI